MASQTNLQDSLRGAPGPIGEVMGTLWLYRVPLILCSVVFLAFTYFDGALGGPVEEAFKIVVMDEPFQAIFVVIALALACAGVRFTGEMMVAMLRPEAFERRKWTDDFAIGWLPRVLSALLCLACLIPLGRVYQDVVQIVAEATHPKVADGATARSGRAEDTLGESLTLTLPFLDASKACVDKASAPDCKKTVETAQAAGNRALGLAAMIFLVAVGAVFAGRPGAPKAADPGASYKFYSLILGTIPVLAAIGLLIAPLQVLFYFGPSIAKALAHYKTVDEVLTLVAVFTGLLVLIAAFRVAVQAVAGIVATATMALDDANREIVDNVAALATAFLSLLAFVWIVLNPNSVGVPAGPFCLLAASLLVSFAGAFGRKTMLVETPVAQLAVGWTEALFRYSTLPRLPRLLYPAALAAALGATIVFSSHFSVPLAVELGTIVVVLIWVFCASVFFLPLTLLSGTTRLPVLTLLFFAAVVYSALGFTDNHLALQLKANVKLDSAHSQRPPGETGATQERIPPTTGPGSALAPNAAATPEQGPTEIAKSLDSVRPLQAWLDTRPNHNGFARYPVVVVATEGGGARAAYITGSVLSAIAEQCPAFLHHVFAISGVSGGAIGGAVFSAAHKAARIQTESDVWNALDCELLSKGTEVSDSTRKGREVSRRIGKVVRDTLRSDFLSPVLSTFFFPDAFQRIFPVPNRDFDRARALEQAIENAWSSASTGEKLELGDNAFSRLSEPVEGKSSALGPYLVLNATVVQSGLPTEITTYKWRSVLSELDSDGNTSALGNCDLAAIGAGQDLSWAAAAVLSARFPYLLPPGRIDCLDKGAAGGSQGALDWLFPSRIHSKHVHLVDGGYYENSGVYAAQKILRNVLLEKLTSSDSDAPDEAAGQNGVERSASEAKRESLERLESSQIIFLLIRTTFDGEELAPQEPVLNELFAPILTMMRTREARMQTSIDELDMNVEIWSNLCSKHFSGLLNAQEGSNNELKDSRLRVLRLLARRLSHICDGAQRDMVAPAPIVQINVLVNIQSDRAIPLSLGLSMETAGNIYRAVGAAVSEASDGMGAAKSRDSNAAPIAVPQPNGDVSRPGAVGQGVSGMDIKTNVNMLFRILRNKRESGPAELTGATDSKGAPMQGAPK